MKGIIPKQKKNLFFLLTLSLFLASFLFLNLKAPPVSAAFPQWSNINVIYYDSREEGPNNDFLKQAANELKIHLEQAGNKTFLVKDTGPNVALGKTGITTSNFDSRYAPLTALTDGIITSIPYVALGRGPQWIQLDLEEQFLISRINIRHYFADSWTYDDVIVQVSEDGTTWQTIFNNDDDNSSGQGIGTDQEYAETPEGKNIILAAPTQARYIRNWSNDSRTGVTWSRFVELEAYGQALIPPTTGIYLKVDPNLPELSSRNDEAFKLFSDTNSITITGKTPIAVRQGVYTLLEKLGFRWFFAHPVWDVVPESLSSLSSLDEVQEPGFIYRRIGYPAYAGGLAELRQWSRRNRVPGAEIVDVQHAYKEIIPAEESLINPEYFCPPLPQQDPEDGTWPTAGWQLDSANQDVIDRAITYALNFFDDGLTEKDGSTGDVLPFSTVSVSPNDFLGYCYGDTEFQKITDDVFNLANKVAEAVADQYPDKYVLNTNYSLYTAIPNFNLEPNLIVPVTTSFNDAGLPFWYRVQEIKDGGAQISIYDYFQLHDKDLFNFNNKLDRIKRLYEMGGKVFITETKQQWGWDGTLMYAASKVLWNPSLELTDILNDFYEKAFGPAEEPMKRYYERWHQDQSFSERALALALQDLDEAETRAQADEKILERIRQVELHTVLLIWDLKPTMWPAEEKDEFKQRIAALGIIDPIDTNGPKADPPFTASEVRQWMDRALAALSGVLNPIDVNVVDPRQLTLMPLGDTTSPKLPPVEIQYGKATFLILGEIGKQVNIKTGGGTIALEDPNEDVLLYNVGPQDFNYTFTQNGLYKLEFYKDENGRQTTAPYFNVEINGAPAAIWAYPELWIGGGTMRESTQNIYFYVPENTPGVVLTMESRTDTTTPSTVRLYNPQGEVELEGDYTSGWLVPYDFGVENPEAGLWRIEIAQSTKRSSLRLIGIAPLLWTDPEYLLIPSTATTPPPFSISSLNRLYLYQSKDFLFEVSGNNFDLNTNFSLNFTQNNTTISSFTFQPKDTTTFELNLTSNEINALPVGFYDLTLERTTDNREVTYSKQVLVTKLGDIWSQAATDQSEQKRDGKINIYDVSRLLSKWGSTNTEDLEEADINPGPNNLSLNKIDLYDANRLMANWLL